MQKGQKRLTLFHFCLTTNWSLFEERVHVEHHYHIKVAPLSVWGRRNCQALGKLERSFSDVGCLLLMPWSGKKRC